MQRIRIALLVTTLMNSFAAWCQPFSGIMMGINGGITQAQAKSQQMSTFNLPIAPLLIQISNGDAAMINDTTGSWGILLGYAQSVNPCWVLGIEGRAQAARTNMTQQFTVTGATGSTIYAPFASSVSIQQQYEILGKVGFLLDPQNLFYGLVGPVWSKADLTGAGMFVLTSPQGGGGPGMIDAQLASSQSRTQWGYALGLGMEHEMCSQLTLGLEYSFIDYGALKFADDVNGVFYINGTPVPGSSTELHQAFHLRNNQIVLRATYYLSIWG